MVQKIVLWTDLVMKEVFKIIVKNNSLKYSLS